MREAASGPVKQRMALLQDVLGELQHAKTHQVCDERRPSLIMFMDVVEHFYGRKIQGLNLRIKALCLYGVIRLY